jgi:outer membrane protein assembly factor BamB
LRWQQTLAGMRRGQAYNLDHLVHIISQSADGTKTVITGLDELTGAKRFELPVPASNETLVNLQRIGSRYVCAAGTSVHSIGTVSTQLMVNMDGLAYAAFTENQWKLQASKCSPGTELSGSEILFDREERVILWQIHPEGAVRSTVVEGLKAKQLLAVAATTASPTGAILTDNLNGVLISIRHSPSMIADGQTIPPDEFVYRINPAGEVLFKFPLPSYSGVLHDDMVIGENDIAFATRGGNLIAFSLHTGKEVWEWDSKTPEISVFAALANGACVVKTPTGMAEVNHGAKTKDMGMDGVPVLGWQGDFYQSHSGPSDPPEQ